MKVICLFDVTETECHYSCETVRENSSGWLDKQSWAGEKKVKMEWGEKKKEESSSNWFKYKENEKSVWIQLM